MCLAFIWFIYDYINVVSWSFLYYFANLAIFFDMALLYGGYFSPSWYWEVIKRGYPRVWVASISVWFLLIIALA